MNKTLFDSIREHLNTLDGDYGISLDGDDRILGILDMLKVIERGQTHAADIERKDALLRCAVEALETDDWQKKLTVSIVIQEELR